MEKLFTHENRLIVFHIKNLLDDAGIPSQIKNEYASGGVGDLSPFDTWPEVWVGDGWLERAQQVIDDSILNEPDLPDWVCNNCGETNQGVFKLCWNCAQGRGI